MTNVEQGLKRLSQHRYSIGQLLALSQTAYNPFDLSKFSFDAARAGVIPSLDDCSMSSRRSSAVRRHFPSTETTSTTEEMAMFPGAEVNAPMRISQPPPASMIAQQHSGFARFLKKHSSPTHQRVTAGGRIVPMEPRRAPPPFPLSRQVNGQMSSEKLWHTSDQNKQASDQVFNIVNQVLSKKPHHPINAQSTTPSIIHQSGETSVEQNVLPNNGWITGACSAACSGAIHAGNTTDCYPALTGVESMVAPCPNLVAGSITTCNHWQTALPHPNGPACHAVGSWPYVDNMMLFGSQQYAHTPGHLTQPILWARNALSEWSNRYNQLDQQLKTLDRHRAMTKLTADIANQRREIVQQRADSKNMMNLISTWLNVSEQVHPTFPHQPVAPRFNADAPAYIPVSQQTNSPAPSTTGLNFGATNGTFQKPASTRRPIAIVPPSELECGKPPASQQIHIPSNSLERDGVDAWGVKLGSAPPEIRERQSEILESISEDQSHSSRSNQSQESLLSAPQGGFFQGEGIVPGTDRESANSTHFKDSIAMEPVNAPPIVEAMYAEGLDALRKPRGTVTTIKMPNGSQIDVDGQELQRPDPSNMSQFEKDYWSRGPNLPHIVVEEGKTEVPGLPPATPTSQALSPGTQDLSGGRCSNKGEGKENWVVTPVIHRKAATDAFLARFNDSDSQDEMILASHESPSQGDSQQLLTNLHERGRRMRLGAVKLASHSDIPGQGRFASDAYAFMKVIQSDRRQTEDQSLNKLPNNVSTDLFYNKGYSSTSVQNVNATAHLPQHIDKNSDKIRNSTSIFSFVGKVKSPRLLRRSNTNGGA